MTGVITTGSAPRLLQLGVQEVWDNANANWEPMYPKLFNVKKASKGAYEVTVQMSNMGLANVKAEGDDIEMDTTKQLFAPKFIHVAYGKGYVITREAKDDNKYNYYREGAQALSHCMNLTREVRAHVLYNTAFATTSAMTGGDGIAMVSTAHLNGNGGTYSNRLAIDANFSEAALEDMLKLIMRAKDDRGLARKLRPMSLIGHTDQMFEFDRVLNSNLRSGTAENDKNAFYKLVDNMMLDLGKIDEGAQVHVISNVGKHLIQQMWETGDQAVRAAAHILNQFITGQAQWQPPAKLSKEQAPEQDKIQEERRQIQNERFTSIRDDVIQVLDKRIQATLDKNIDPNGSMTEFTKNAAITEAKRQIQTAIKSDVRFQKLMNQAWVKAARSNYSKDSTEFLKKNYSNKTQLLLPAIIKNVRNQALRGYKRSANSDVKVNVREPQKRGPVAAGNSAPQSRGKQSASKTPPPGGVKNFLMSDSE